MPARKTSARPAAAAAPSDLGAAPAPDAAAEAVPVAAPVVTFADLALAPTLLTALERLGYAAPTPIQVRTIPTLLAGRDMLGQAQTGTGKTAAFALPMLQRLDMEDRSVQALVLVPTRELALQVAEAIQKYSEDMGKVGVLAIFGGDPIHNQLRRLEGAVRVVVGTPGRVLDHLARGSLKLDKVRMAVLDEADEMLRMGFVDDVDTILGKMPTERQTALFSATLPDEIARIARRHLRNPDMIAVTAQTRTVATVEQHYIVVAPHERAEALARLLTVEDIDAALVFARTRAGCAELAELLEARGFAVEAMHGDMAQSARLSVIRRLKNGQLRIVVATDVAARGLDVEQVNLVVNVELPGDSETYVHRIGRTGRAGRLGKAVLFVTPREERRLRELERFTGQKLLPMRLPTDRDLHDVRVARFAAKVQAILDSDDLTLFRPMVARLVREGQGVEDVAAAIARLAWGDKPLPVEAAPVVAAAQSPANSGQAPANSGQLPPGPGHPTAPSGQPSAATGQPIAISGQPVTETPRQPPRQMEPPPAGFDGKRPRQSDFPGTPRAPMPSPQGPGAGPGQGQGQGQDQRQGSQQAPRGPVAWLSLGVGRRNGVLPRDIVGAIANEAGIAGSAIGGIDIRENFTLVQLPAAAVPQVLERMRRAMICGRYLNLRVMEDTDEPTSAAPPRVPVRQPTFEPRDERPAQRPMPGRPPVPARSQEAGRAPGHAGAYKAAPKGFPEGPPSRPGPRPTPEGGGERPKARKKPGT